VSGAPRRQVEATPNAQDCYPSSEVRARAERVRPSPSGPTRLLESAKTASSPYWIWRPSNFRCSTNRCRRRPPSYSHPAHQNLVVQRSLRATALSSYARIQPWQPRRAEECHRFSVQRVDRQSGRVHRLRIHHGRSGHREPAPVMASLQVATVRPHVGLSLVTDFEGGTAFKPTETQEKNLNNVLDHVIAWSSALKVLRKPARRIMSKKQREQS